MIQKKQLFILFFLVQIIMIQFLKFFPSVVEQYYSNKLFVYISTFLRTIFGSIPISVGDLVYSCLILFLISTIWNVRKKWKLNWKSHFLQAVNFVAFIYFLFYFLWALNYYRKPLFEKMKIENVYSDQELYLFTEKLITKTNQIQFEITKKKNLKVVVPISEADLIKQAQIGYDNLSNKYSFFRYQIPSIKKSLFSIPLSYMGFSGYLNPFTNEAQYNSQVPKYGLPMTICHEMAHQIGYASESECNFIGFLAAIKNDNLYFRYAANTLALKYCLRIIQNQNQDKAKLYRNKINAGIIDNFNDDKQFYLKYHTFIETGFEIFYDNFLKLNQQKEGIESYSKFLDLLINYNKLHPNYR